jgi:hypothetical protein
MINMVARWKLLIAALWLLAGIDIFIYVAASHIDLLRRPEPFQISKGPEQSVLIFEAVAIYALIEGTLQLRNRPYGFWVRKILSFIILLDSLIWLLFGGPVYEPWYFSLAIASLLVASGCSLCLSRPNITPNNTVERDGPEAARPSQ